MPVKYGERAGLALGTVFPGPHTDKQIARAFGISLRMAKYLRRGESWTLARMEQASELLGDAFDAAMSTPAPQSTREIEMQELRARMARLEGNLAQMARWRAELLAQETDAARDDARRGVEPNPLPQSWGCGIGENGGEIY